MVCFFYQISVRSTFFDKLLISSINNIFIDNLYPTLLVHKNYKMMDVLVLWDDGTRNVVSSNKLKTQKYKRFRVGNKAKMFYGKKLDKGTILVTEKVQTSDSQIDWDEDISLAKLKKKLKTKQSEMTNENLSATEAIVQFRNSLWTPGFWKNTVKKIMIPTLIILHLKTTILMQILHSEYAKCVNASKSSLVLAIGAKNFYVGCIL